MRASIMFRDGSSARWAGHGRNISLVYVSIILFPASIFPLRHSLASLALQVPCDSIHVFSLVSAESIYVCEAGAGRQAETIPMYSMYTGFYTTFSTIRLLSQGRQ